MPASSNKTSSNWIDLSVTVQEGMIAFPSEAPLQLERRRSMARGDKANNTTLHMSVHTGTHMDAPDTLSLTGRPST